ncbi:hypothetical protein VNI00_008938 [Paramarasmius palmivorus]|uniref:DUF6534 domain-containing protein n=1 Tax=Paramarasmius palmivorus TaxID=297713 RepID=A0AAW0CRQ9_9AGAR
MTCHTVYHYSKPLFKENGPYMYVAAPIADLACVDAIPNSQAAEAIGLKCRLSYSPQAKLFSPLAQLFRTHGISQYVPHAHNTTPEACAQGITVTNGKVYRKPLLAIFIFLVTAQFGFGLYVSISAFLLWELTKLFTLVYPGLVPMYVIRVVVDGLAAAVLCTVLHDSKAEFRGSVKLVRTLIIYAMNRFLLTTLVVIMQTIVLLVRPQSIWAMVIDFVTVHLYVNSLLATLNARNRLRMIQSHPPTYIQSGSGKYQTGGTRHEIDTQDSTRFQPPHEGRETRAVQSKSKTSVNVVLDEGSGYESDGIKVRTETFVMTDLEPNRKNAPSGNLV